MQPILIIVLATAASVPLGLWLRHNLATLGYRNVDEVDLPAPGPRWWVVCASVLALSSLAAIAVMSRDSLAYLPLLPLAIVGPWLAAVDFDVLRIPNQVLAPTTGTILLAIAGAATARPDSRVLVVAVAAASLTGGVFIVVRVVTGGGIGLGDVKLTGAIGLAVGPLGVRTALLSVLVGSLAALVWAHASRRTGPIPLGPWLLLGASVAAAMDVTVG